MKTASRQRRLRGEAVCVRQCVWRLPRAGTRARRPREAPAGGEAAPKAVGAAARRGPSGDDLEGDFAEAAAEDEPVPKGANKLKRSKGEGRGDVSLRIRELLWKPKLGRS
mgnify:CR=1 FL=1